MVVVVVRRDVREKSTVSIRFARLASHRPSAASSNPTKYVHIHPRVYLGVRAGVSGNERGEGRVGDSVPDDVHRKQGEVQPEPRADEGKAHLYGLTDRVVDECGLGWFG